MDKVKLEYVIEMELANSFRTPYIQWQFVRGALNTAHALDAITDKEYTYLYFAYRTLLDD